jgi:hypothetical protein
MTRKEWCDKIIIADGDVKELLKLAEGYPCACMGAKDSEPECFCKMNSKQIRETFSLVALKRGQLIRLKHS